MCVTVYEPQCEFKKGTFFPIISVLRVGKSVDFVHSALQSLHISDNVLRWTITLSKINQAVYLLFDHIVLAGRIGIAKVGTLNFESQK